MVSVRRSENLWKLVTWNEVWCLKLQRKLTFIFQIGLSHYTAFSFRMNIGLNLSWKMYSPHNKLINVLKKHLQQMQANPGELFWPGSSMPTWRDCMCSKSNFEAALNVGLRIHGWWFGMLKNCQWFKMFKKKLVKVCNWFFDCEEVMWLQISHKASSLFERQHICGESICSSKISI